MDLGVIGRRVDDARKLMLGLVRRTDRITLGTDILFKRTMDRNDAAVRSIDVGEYMVECRKVDSTFWTSFLSVSAGNPASRTYKLGIHITSHHPDSPKSLKKRKEPA